MQRVYGLIHQASAYTYPVLITGEKGAGKTRAAHVIHSLCPRKGSAFVISDCSNVAPTLAESELFGYEKGAFSGAAQAQWGLFAFARRSTVLLKEVGNLPLHVQGKFAAMLQEREFRPIGSSHPLPFNARVLATTSRDLRADVERGNFREDLFFRLSALQINVAPLRERKQDIPLLVDYFLEKCEAGQSRAKFSDAAMRYLCDQDWPGNVGELEGAVRRAISLTSGRAIEIGDLKLCVEPPIIVGGPLASHRILTIASARELLTRFAKPTAISSLPRECSESRNRLFSNVSNTIISAECSWRPRVSSAHNQSAPWTCRDRQRIGSPFYAGRLD